MKLFGKPDRVWVPLALVIVAGVVGSCRSQQPQWTENDGGVTKWIDIPAGRLKTRVYTGAATPRSPVLVLVLHGAYGWLVRRFDLVSTICLRMQARLREFGVPEERLCLFPNWVDTGAIRPLPGPSALRRQLGTPGSEGAFAALARILEAVGVAADGRFRIGMRFGEREVFRFPPPIGPVGVVLAAQDEVCTLPRVIPMRALDVKIGGNDFERLPVVGADGRFLGVLAKRDVLAVYAQEVLGRPALLATFVSSDEDAPGSRRYVEIPPDFALRQVPVPPSLEGKTLAEARLPHVSRGYFVMRWKSHLLPPAGHERERHAERAQDPARALPHATDNLRPRGQTIAHRRRGVSHHHVDRRRGLGAVAGFGGRGAVRLADRPRRLTDGDRQPHSRRHARDPLRERGGCRSAARSGSLAPPSPSRRPWWSASPAWPGPARPAAPAR